MYRYILFDLDGTLTDPGLGITNSVAYALEHWGIAAERDELYRFIGPPLIGSFERFYGFSHEDALKALAIYREYFGKKGIYENSLLDGAVELLEALKARGKTIILATSKPDLYSLQIIKHFGIDRYFSFCSCATMEETRTDKAEVIQYALDSCGITDARECLMVGDREHDVIGAKKCGVDCVGVLCGYGSREELCAAGAKYVAESIYDVLKIVDDNE